ncbi:MAG: thioredoxin [Casimicrobiaceae bacterium]
MNDITIENFETDVLKQSLQTPVLVDFWATWCGPCRTLGPILEKLEVDYGGRFILAKVDSDRERELSQAFGVRSIPTVILIKGGQPVDGFVGALPEGEIRAFLDKHVPAEGALASEEDEEEADVLLAEGDVDGAIEKLREAIAIDPANEAARFDYARLLIESGNLGDARVALEPVQDKIAGHVTDLRFVALDLYLQAHEAVVTLPAEEKLRAALTADPRNFESWLGLAQWAWIRGESAAAMDALLEVIRRDRGWKDGLARRTYIAIIELLTSRTKPVAAAPQAAPSGKLITNAAAPATTQDPLIGEYRRKLSMALY